MKGLKGKVAIVSGAARGIGRAITERLCTEGVKVIMVDINPQVIETHNEIEKHYDGDIGFPFVADITRVPDIQNMVRETIKRYRRIDILVNNAGVNKPASALVNTSEGYFNEVMDVNFKGMFLCSREVAKEMIQKKSGTIINIGSAWGKTGHPFFSVYCSSKAAGIVFTQVIAIELAPYNIRVNSICPGYIDTEMHDNAVREEAERRGISADEIFEAELQQIIVGRYGRPEEIAAAVAFVASDEAPYIAGQAINVNGGVEFH